MIARTRCTRIWATPGGTTIVSLGVGEFSSQKYKRVPRPDFKIIDWENSAADATVKTVQPAATVKVQPDAAVKTVQPAAVELDDEIPF